MSDCVTWEEGDIVWNVTDFTWSEICLLVEIVKHSGGYSARTRKLREKDKQTQKTFIKLQDTFPSAEKSLLQRGSLEVQKNGCQVS